VGYEVDCMTKTSSPRTFSWISTNISWSANRRTLALPKGTLRYRATASAKTRLELPAKSFIKFPRRRIWAAFNRVGSYCKCEDRIFCRYHQISVVSPAILKDEGIQP